MQDSSRLVLTLERLSSPVCRALAYLACAGIGGPVVYQLARGSNAYLGLFEDDFFYYAIIADKLVTLGKLTFDGVTLTNGFHPLWFVVVLAVRLVCGGLGPAFFAGIGLLLIGAMVATYETFRLLARSLGAPAALAAPLAVLQIVETDKILSSGMEVALAIPFYTWLLAEVARGGLTTPRRAAKLGLLASLAVLSRLDLVVAVAILIGAWLLFVRPPVVEAIRSLVAFGCGGAALVAYFAFNAVVFGALLPTSAQAKELRTAGGLNIGFLKQNAIAYGPKTVPILLLGLAALVLLVRGSPGVRSPVRLAGGVALVFPPILYVLNAALSDWCSFAWYAYPLGTALVAASVLIWEFMAPRLRAPTCSTAAAVALALPVVFVAVSATRFFVFHAVRWSVADNTLTAMAVELADRMRGRQGKLAMGDKAGIATLLLNRGVLQLEGLVADRALLEHVRRQDPLDRVMDEHGVDYLIVSLGATRLDKRDGCYVVVHPNPDQAGPLSAKMTAKICAEPIVHFQTPHGPNPWSRYLALETFVFDLRGERRATVTPL